MIPARIVALRAFKHAVVHEIGSWLYDGFRCYPLPMHFHASRAFRTHRTHRLEFSRYRFGLLLNSLRLALRGNRFGALLDTLVRRVMPLFGLLLGRRSCDNRSR